MTRKHFTAIAEALKAEAASPEVVATMASTLARFNPHFDRARFIEAATA